jgi:hypothetical protein
MGYTAPYLILLGAFKQRKAIHNRHKLVARVTSSK